MDLRAALRSQIVLRDRMAAAVPLSPKAHDILLQLALARVEGRRVNLKGATGHLPAATAARHVALLVEAGLIHREPCTGGRVWLSITDEGFARVSALFGVPVLARVA